MAMTVLVCDSVPVVRDGLTSLLSEAPDVTRVSATGNAVECLVMARKLKPDVLITDLSPEGMDGIDFVHRVIRENAQERDGRPGVVVFASDMTDRVIEKLLRAGAITLLEKETGREMLLTAVRAAARGEVMLAPHVTGRLVRWFRSREFGPDRAPDPQVESLTPVSGRSSCSWGGAADRGDRRETRHRLGDRPYPHLPATAQAQRPGPRSARLLRPQRRLALRTRFVGSLGSLGGLSPLRSR